ncbi:ABC transporter ATP-binding protein [Paenibacillus sp. NPDC058071]|uniref:ABC transporter ATP-binding protein n=1 Tax=Paenibacillus sp. NPDC058071 TaxID=3346326 RepID=UPI0036DD40D2
MNSDIAVKTEGLVKTFSGVEVIRGCTMTVNKGTIYGFLGGNGAGKTTVMKILTGLLHPTAGKATVLGMDVTVNRDEVLRRVGSLIEVPVFFEQVSAEENMTLHLAYMGMKDVNITEVLEKVGLVNTGDQPVSKFSLGMRQRLAIARALIHQPELLILDEPLNGLDPMGIRDIRELLLNLTHQEGMTILLSSHILSEIEHIADTVGIIAQGRVVREMKLEEIKQQYPSGLEAYFFGMMSGGHELA